MTSMGVDTQAPATGASGVAGSALRLVLQQIAPVDGDRQALLAQITVRMLPQVPALLVETAGVACVPADQ
jgi:hypothetical protein